MPWEIKQRGSKYVVVKKGTNEVVGTHNSRTAAVAHLRALYANTEEER